ncbi:MAG: hypothetical protein ACYCR7_07070 [Thermoplasmataceae archaeon]
MKKVNLEKMDISPHYGRIVNIGDRKEAFISARLKPSPKNVRVQCSEVHRNQ